MDLMGSVVWVVQKRVSVFTFFYRDYNGATIRIQKIPNQ